MYIGSGTENKVTKGLTFIQILINWNLLLFQLGKDNSVLCTVSHWVFTALMCLWVLLSDACAMFYEGMIYDKVIWKLKNEIYDY